jgi:molybdopterin-containing oxidoreductase family iron-sulfur binding subunit
MKEMKENYWSGVEEYIQDDKFVESTNNEFFESPILNDLSSGDHENGIGNTSRRDFLKYMGFGLGAATIAAGCETPIRKAVPYVVKPDSIVPGVANYYASTFVKGNDVLPVVVKTREGRPIKIEGNTLSSFSNGGTSARAQASVLDLYETGRFQNPGTSDSKGGFKKTSWGDLDKAVMGGLNASTRVAIISNSINSPSTLAAIEAFKAAFPATNHVTYDPISSSAIIMANERSFGKKVFPGYHFDQATLVVNFGADFLGTWVSPVEYASAWAAARKVKDFKNPDITRLIQFESNMSYTGSNADNRLLIKPSEQGLAIAKLYNALSGGSLQVSGALSDAKSEKSIATVAKDLMDRHNAGKATLVLSDSNNVAEQIIINKINELLGNYGRTIDLNNFSNQRKGVDTDMVTLISSMKSGAVDIAIVLGDANPAFDLPDAKAFADAFSKVKTRVTCALIPNETTALCTHSAPDNHFLESWGDAQPRNDVYSVIQPTIAPLYNTRQAELSLLTWAQHPASKLSKDTAYLSFVQENWNKSLFSRQSNYSSFQTFWDNTIHDGIIEMPAAQSSATVGVDVASLASAITQPQKGAVEVKVYESIGVGSGAYANNPWLQELPDPVTRSVWNSLLHIPVSWDGDSNFVYYLDLNKDGLLVEVANGSNKIAEIPVVRQFGQMKDTVAMPLGYGRKQGSPAAINVGVDTYSFLSRDKDGNTQYWAGQVKVTPTGGRDKDYASVQDHHTMGVRGKDKSGKEINVDEKEIMVLGNGYQGGFTDRSILYSADIANLEEKTKALKAKREVAAHLNNETIYPGHQYLYEQGHHWGMSIDTTLCIGCGACQVACMSENNVPVVGKHEVHRHHEMTWLRIDRYYFGDVSSPNVFYQPMMCQHCDNAPCENVCPVNATNHGAEGINQMAYNRCVGTRYCANNCPYKVRRFNWADYTTADLFPFNESNFMPDGTSKFYEDNIVRMVFNPDVTVRSRGVMEKCSLCFQRIQEGKLKAKIEKRDVQDGDIKTACVSACPTGAIQFGDQNKKDGLLMKHWAEPTSYFVLEEINTRSNIGYKMKVTNKNKDLA